MKNANFKNSEEDNTRIDEANSLLKVHFFYVVLILSGIIVIISTRDWTKLVGFTEYLSVAATITSLVLGVLAIIYSFVSSGSTNQFLGSIESSASGMREIGAELEKLLAGGQDVQRRAERRNEELYGIIGDLRAAVDTISNKTTEIAGGLPNHFNDLKEAINSKESFSSAKNLDHSSKFDKEWSKKEISIFLSQASPIGFSSILGGLYAYKEKKYVDLRKLFATDKSFYYVYGFLVAVDCAEIVEFDISEDREQEYSHYSFANVTNNFESAINEELERRKLLDNGKYSKKYNDYIENINNSLVNEK